MLKTEWFLKKKKKENEMMPKNILDNEFKKSQETKTQIRIEKRELWGKIIFYYQIII